MLVEAKQEDLKHSVSAGHPSQSRVVLVEAKQEDLKPAMGQCLAEMVAAQRFNQRKHQPIETIDGTVTNSDKR